MSTRTTGKRLQARIDDRWDAAGTVHAITVRHHIRAELQRVARQIRKLDDSNRGKHKQTIHFTCGYYQAIHDVLELIRKATR